MHVIYKTIQQYHVEISYTMTTLKYCSHSHVQYTIYFAYFSVYLTTVPMLFTDYIKNIWLFSL